MIYLTLQTMPWHRTQKLIAYCMNENTYQKEMLKKIEDLIFLEADLLDRKQWQNWLELYTSDCVIWVPSWESEEQLVGDPELSVNMMYLVGKPALEARVHRITSVDAYASLPLARTMHSVTNIR